MNCKETVEEVCEKMYAIGNSYYAKFADRITSAYEREMAAKDAEIERLKEERNHARLDAQKKFGERIAFLERALKPVMEFNLQNMQSDPISAVREAQRIMKEGEVK